MREASYKVPQCKKIRVILDTDCYCEADDQFALAHALMSPKLDVVGITAEHYADLFGPNSQDCSYNECLHVLKLMGLDDRIPVFHGAKAAMTDEKTPVMTEAAEFIIKEALRDDPRPLFIAGQGALTNVASAVLACPEIGKHITMVWNGGATYPNGEFEFNVANDVNATNVVLASDIAIWQVPKNLYSKMYVPMSVLYQKVWPCGEIGKYLVENIARVQDIFCDWINRPGYTEAEMACGYPGGEMWILGDNDLIGLMLFDQRYSFELRPCPRVDADCNYLPGDKPEKKIRVYTEIDREFIMDDFYAKIQYYFG